MPPEREAARALLASAGVDVAVGVAWQFEPAHIIAVLARWEQRNAEGDRLGPGWIVWRLKQGPIEAVRKPKREMDWLEERYRRGKAVNS